MCVLRRSQMYPERKSQQPFLYDVPKGDFKVGFTCAVVSIVDFLPQTPNCWQWVYDSHSHAGKNRLHPH